METTDLEYFEANQVDGVIPPEKMAGLLLGGELPAVEAEQEAVPEEEAQPEPMKEVVPAEPAAVPEKEPVIMAKDGVHTIPYEKLVEARVEASSARTALEEQISKNAELQAAMDKMATAQNAQVEGTATQEETNEILDEVRKEFPDLVTAFETMLTKERGFYTAQIAAQAEEINTLKSDIAPVKEKAVEADKKEHFDSIRKVHSDLDAIIAGEELGTWIESQSPAVQKAYVEDIKGGNDVAIIKMLDTFKAATGYQPPAGDTAGQGKQADGQTAAGIPAPKRPVPTSLSEIPGGSQVPHNQVDAIMSAGNPLKQIDAFMGKTPDQIEEILRKAV